MPLDIPVSEERDGRAGRDDDRPAREDDPALGLPALGDDDEQDGVGDGDIEVDDPAAGGDPFDDALADDVPLEAMIATGGDEPSALGDDAVGLDGASAA